MSYLNHYFYNLIRYAKNTAKYGRYVSKTHDIGIVKQVVQQVVLRIIHQMPIEMYYKYKLYIEERYKLCDCFVPDKWMKEKIHNKIVCSVESNDEGSILDNKYKFYKWCNLNGVKTIPVLAVFENGKLIHKKWEGEPDLPKEDLFSKNLDFAWGEAAQRWAYCGEDQYTSGSVGRLSAAELVDELRRDSREQDLVLQRRVLNASSIDRFSLGGLCTIRVVTCSNKQKDIEPLFATLRMPTGDSVADNFQSGGIAAPVDLETGQLGSAVAKYPTESGDFYETHPDTGAQIKESRVPCWEEVLDLVRFAHEQFQRTVTVGWDVAITEDGPIVIEGNKRWGVETLEIVHGRPLTSTAFPEYYRHWTGEELEADLKRQ